MERKKMTVRLDADAYGLLVDIATERGLNLNETIKRLILEESARRSVTTDESKD